MSDTISGAMKIDSVRSFFCAMMKIEDSVESFRAFILDAPVTCPWNNWIYNDFLKIRLLKFDKDEYRFDDYEWRVLCSYGKNMV